MLALGLRIKMKRIDVGLRCGRDEGIYNIFLYSICLINKLKTSYFYFT